MNTFTDLYLNDRKLKRIEQLKYEGMNYSLLAIIFLQSTLFSFVIPGFNGVGNIMFSFGILAIIGIISIQITNEKTLYYIHLFFTILSFIFSFYLYFNS